jgi:Uma2 family endonuclease
MTTEELLALPEDGVERWLIWGHLREKRGEDVTLRNRWVSRSQAQIIGLLGQWLDRQPQPRGELYSGKICFCLRRQPDSTVDMDVAYVSAEVAARGSDDDALIVGLPVLAVEILSPSTTQEEIDEKVHLYLEVGIPLTWVVNTPFRTVTVYRPGAEPEMKNTTQELSGEPHLPGFRVSVAQVFAL